MPLKSTGLRVNPSNTVHMSMSDPEAFAPGADGVAAWVDWRDGRVVPEGDEPPALKDIKPMQRRRLSLLARCVFQVAGSVLRTAPSADGLACVFASAIGQCSATLKMLEVIGNDQAISPQAFSLSVHNAIAGQFSIAHGLNGPSITLAPGRDGLGGVLQEAAILAAESDIDRVLVCCFDEPVPEALRPYEANPPTPLAAAWLVEPAGAEDTFAVSRSGLDGGDEAATEAPIETPFWRQLRDLVAHLGGSSQDAFVLDSGGIEYVLERV